MAEIKPFKGIVYDKEKIDDLKDVTTPPYDVITKAEQDGFYAKNEYNVIRLILGKESEHDSLSDNRYTRSAEFLENWLSSGVLKQDETDSIYAYQQSYHLPNGTMKTRIGFIALIKLEDFSSGKILPHEKTLSGPKSDRLNLMKSCHCNFSQIFSLYSDKKLKVDNIIEESILGKQPDMHVTDALKTFHAIFRISDAEVISRIAALMKDKNIFIADGHHRYETALNFRDHIRKEIDTPETSPYNYVMMYLSNMDSDGLAVFPTHRVLFNLPERQIGFLKANIDKYFTVTDFPFTKKNEKDVLDELSSKLESAGKKNNAFGMYCKDDDSYKLLVADDMSKIEPVIKKDMAESLKGLDVTVLHSVIINHLLGISTESQEKQENLRYVKGSHNAVKLIKEEDYQIAFLLNPPRVEQVEAVASSGNKMPQKSTFFYPKLLTGLVINKLNP
jgi:uncharacterized protein (DUF1015 family)